MDTLTHALKAAPDEPESLRRVRAFRATDHFALAAWQAVRAK